MHSDEPKFETFSLLANQAAYEDAIAKLKSIPAAQRSEKDNLAIAHALIFHMDWLTPSRREELEQAVSLLSAMDKRYARAPEFCYLMGAAYYQLEDYKEAAAWYKKAPDSGFQPSKQDILAICRRVLKRPAEPESFRSRVKRAWDAFAPVEAELRQMANDAEDNPKIEKKFIDRVSKLLDIAFLDSAWNWNGGEYPLLQLDPGHFKIAALQQQYFVDQAPEEVDDHWYLSVGESTPSYEELEELKQDGGYLSDMDVQIERIGDDLLKLVMYHPSLDPKKITKKVTDNVMEKAMFNLGEGVFLGTFFNVDFRGMPPKGSTVKLGNLLPTLDAMGYGDPDGPENILYRRHRISRTAEVLPSTVEHHWREDIFQVFTMDPALEMSYSACDTEDYLKPFLGGTGAIPGFVVFPLQGQTDNPPFLMQTLLKELDDTMEEEIALVLGNAEGLQFGYLDLLAWDLEPALETVKGILQEHGLPWACWHTFYNPDRTVPLF